jgi:hypothetical protein
MLAPAASAQGNSEAAHACNHGGFNSLVGTAGQTFVNVGACVEYAANGGKFASGIVIPKGHTATLTNGEFDNDNAASYGYQLNFGANVTLASKPFTPAGAVVPVENVTLGPFSTAELIRVFLTDETCSDTFYSDGDHGTVHGSNPFTIEIADAGGECEAPEGVAREGANLVTTLTIN